MGKFLKKQILIQGAYNPYAWYIAPYAYNFTHAITAVYTGSLFVGIVLSLFFSWARIVLSSVMALYFVLPIICSVQQSIRYNRLFILPFGFLAFHISHGLRVRVDVIRLVFGSAPVQKMKQCVNPVFS